MSYYALKYTYAGGLNRLLDMGNVIGVLSRKQALALCAARAAEDTCKYSCYTVVQSDVFLQMLAKGSTVSNLEVTS